MVEYHDIMGCTENGEVIHLFLWRGNKNEGIHRAWKDEENFKLGLEKIWSMPHKTS